MKIFCQIYNLFLSIMMPKTRKLVFGSEKPVPGFSRINVGIEFRCELLWPNFSDMTLFNHRLIEVGDTYCSCVQTSSMFLWVKSYSLFFTQQIDLSGELESSGHLLAVARHTLPIFRNELSQEVEQPIYVCRTYQNGTTLDSRKQKFQKARVAESKKIKILNTSGLATRSEKHLFIPKYIVRAGAQRQKVSIPPLRADFVCHLR